MRHETGSVENARTMMKGVNGNPSGSEGPTDMIASDTIATAHGLGNGGGGGMMIERQGALTVGVGMAKRRMKSASAVDGVEDTRNGARREPALAQRMVQTRETMTNAGGGTGGR